MWTGVTAITATMTKLLAPRMSSEVLAPVARSPTRSSCRVIRVDSRTGEGDAATSVRPAKTKAAVATR